MIDRPKLPFIHPDRARECAGAIENDDFALLDKGRAVRPEEFQALAKRAQAAGWMPEEITSAMHSLGAKYIELRQAERVRRAPAAYHFGYSRQLAPSPPWRSD